MLHVESIVGLHDEERLAREESPQRCDRRCAAVGLCFVMPNPRVRGTVNGQLQQRHQREEDEAEGHGYRDAVRGASHTPASPRRL